MINQGNKQSKPSLMLLFSAILALICFSLSLQAAQVSPSQPGESAPMSHKLKPIDPNNQLFQNDDESLDKVQQKKGWFCWLTDISRKPANFHYIDFIELFIKP